AEECQNPQRDLPFGIIASLIICTVLYVGVAIVLLGMMRYTTFISGPAADAPVAYALKFLGAHPFFQAVIVIGALMGMISSILVSMGVIILRRRQPDRRRGFKVPLVPWFPLASIILCGGLMMGLTVITWIRFFAWLIIGLLIYFFYSRKHSEFATR